MPFPRPLVAFAALLAAAPLALGCRKPEKTFESVVQLVRFDVAETDGDGKPVLADAELEWDPCPGDQMEVVRGGKEFAECMGKHKVGEMLPAKVRWSWDDHGYYRWDVIEVAGCKRPPQVGDVSSFEKVQECSDVQVHGVAIGFQCNRKPYAELTRICPWMRRN